MTRQVRTSLLSDRWVCVAALTVLAATLLATSSVGTYLISGSRLMGMAGWPQPLGWITQLLVIESWPTYERIEVRWFAWAIGATVLVLLAMIKGERATGRSPVTDAVFTRLTIVGVALSVLVAVRAGYSAVPVVGLAWTWQLVLSLLWMVAIYTWTVRAGAARVVAVTGLSIAGLAGITFLGYIQSDQPEPIWPTGNVLLLSTACLAGVFLLGAWACRHWVMGERTHRWRHYCIAAVATSLVAMTVGVLWLAARRSGAVGLSAGAIFILAVGLARWKDGSRDAVQKSRRVRVAILAVAIGAVAAAAAVLPAVLDSRRWVSVSYRADMYKTAAAMLGESAAVSWIGIGPGQMGFRLTADTRRIRSEKAWDAGIEEYAHSEPLQAFVELGIPLGLVYLVLPLVGMWGFAVAGRQATERSYCWIVIGGGSALAACLASEATGIGMRHPGVAMLVWTLAGMGWACGAQAGLFLRLSSRLGWAVEAVAPARRRVIWGVSALVISAAVLGLAQQSVQSSHVLYKARQLWEQGDVAPAAAVLDTWPCVQTSGAWMAWKYTQGRLYLAMLGSDRSMQGRAVDQLITLCNACPAYLEAPVWLGRAYRSWDRLRPFCHDLLRYDPYDYEACLTLAEDPQASVRQRLPFVRLAMRNASVTGPLAQVAMRVVQAPAAQEQLAAWVADARKGAAASQPVQSSDPLALESLRLAIVVAAEQGRNDLARDLSVQASHLLDDQADDPTFNRTAAVLAEVDLDRLWFGWLVDPSIGPAALTKLEALLSRLPYSAGHASSQRMAAQFAAVLYLRENRFEQASHALYISDPTMQWPQLTRMAGLANARLVAIMASSAGPTEVDFWSRRGVELLGADGWQQALSEASRVGKSPWWYGVLGQ